MKKPRFLIRLLCLLLALGMLAGCGSPSGAEETAETIPTEPVPTTPPNGDPTDVTCLGSYTVSNAEVSAAADTVAATIGDAKLTNSQLQVYYWLEVAAYRQSDAEPQPDYGQSLDIQSCPIDSSVASWQQYFLKAALNTWHTHQALVLMAEQEGVPKEAEYDPDLEKHQEYMTDKPAYQYHRAHFESYVPNTMHQAYLDTLPETLATLASDSGFGDAAAMAEAIAGSGAAATDLEEYAHTANLAYMYFVERGYQFQPTAEEVESWYAENQAAVEVTEDKTIDLRHILLIPENAQVAEDGTVTCTEEDWEAAYKKAQSLVNKWQTAVKKTRFSQYAAFDTAEARFSEYAKNNSADEGSRANGGLYVNIRKGQLVDVLDNWCFDPARQHGNYEILRSDCGYHIVFFNGATENWFSAAEAGLIRQMGSDLVAEALEKYPADIRYSDIKLGQAPDNGSFVTGDQLLYADIAHERFPELPLYLQQDYPDAAYGNYKVSSHGCSITTLAMVASYMTDDELTPAELGARYGYYCGERGTEICIFDDTPAEMGFHLMKRSYSWSEMDAALDNGQVVVSLQYAGYWTSGGHYLAMIRRTEDGKYVVRDSNLLNYRRISAHVEDAHTRHSINAASQYYWIYEPKVVRSSACVRCSDGLTPGAPGILFREDYHCAKCLSAMERRDNFLSN